METEVTPSTPTIEEWRERRIAAWTDQDEQRAVDDEVNAVMKQEELTKPTPTTIAHIASTNTVESLKQPALDLPTEVNWKDRGIALAQEHRLRQFTIADWLLEGIELVGATETYDLAEALFPQYARQTFLSWVMVAKHFPACIRIQSDFLTFAHYQVVKGCAGISEGHDNADFQTAQELVWLRKADEFKMSVSVLRESVRTCWVMKGSVIGANEAADKMLAAAHKEWEKAEPKKENFSPKWLNKEVKDNALPKWLSEKQLKWRIESLAVARGIEPHELVKRAMQDFIDAHSDELGDAKAAQEKRESEQFSADAAAIVVETELQRACNEHNEKVRQEKHARDLAETQRRQAEELARKAAEIERNKLLRIEEDRLAPVIKYIEDGHDTTKDLINMRNNLLLELRDCSWPIDKVRASVNRMLEMLPQSDDALKSESQEVTASKIAEPSHDEKLTVDGHKYHWVDGPTQGGTATRTGWYTTYNCFAHHDHTQEAITKAWTELQEVTA
jgi:hypothetical protein